MPPVDLNKMVQVTEPTRGPEFPWLPHLLEMLGIGQGNPQASAPPANDPWLAGRARSAAQGFADQQAADRATPKAPMRSKIGAPPMAGGR